MKLLRSVFLLALVAPTAYAGVLGNYIATQFCPTVQNVLKVPAGTTCACTGDFQFGKGVMVSASCKLTNPVCIVPPNFCGLTTVDANFNAKLLRGASSLNGGFTACVKIDSGIPDGAPSVGDLCVAANVDPVAKKLTSCSVTLGGTKCNSCTVCSSGLAVQFDCSNIDLLGGNGPVVVPGPVANTCYNVI
jgi:hypothetical protein